MRGYKAKLAAGALFVTVGAVTPLGQMAMAQTAQERLFIQIEARNNLASAQERLGYWASALPDVQGFALSSGWFGIFIGPYDQSEALEKLQVMRAKGQIPGDSFIPDQRLIRQPIALPAQATPQPLGAPIDDQITASPIPLEPAQPLSGEATRPEPMEPSAQIAPIDPTQERDPSFDNETLEAAMADEARLDRQARMDIQRALNWSGHYASGFDGSFGRGTRSAIAAWQTAQGLEGTGFLTTSQRQRLIEDWQTDINAPTQGMPVTQQARPSRIKPPSPDQPMRAGSGALVATQGLVLTSASVVESCGRVTLEGGIPAQLVASDSTLGYALLSAQSPLRAKTPAKLTAAPPNAGSKIAAASYAFGYEMPRAALNFGRFEGAIAQDPAHLRLTLNAMPSEVGAPVIGMDGLVVGLLQEPKGGQQTMTPMGAIAQDLTAKGQRLPLETPKGGEMAAEDLTALGLAMAIQVACWR